MLTDRNAHRHVHCTNLIRHHRSRPPVSHVCIVVHCGRLAVVGDGSPRWRHSPLSSQGTGLLHNTHSVGLKLNIQKQAQHRAAAVRSRNNSHGVIQYKGSYFPTRCQEWIFILIVLVEKKHTQLIFHMPWLYQYSPLPISQVL